MPSLPCYAPGTEKTRDSFLKGSLLKRASYPLSFCWGNKPNRAPRPGQHLLCPSSSRSFHSGGSDPHIIRNLLSEKSGIPERLFIRTEIQRSFLSDPIKNESCLSPTESSSPVTFKTVTLLV